MIASRPADDCGRLQVEALTAGGVKVCPVRLVRRLDFVNGLPEGLAAGEWNPVGKAAKEAEALWEWVRTKIYPR